MTGNRGYHRGGHVPGPDTPIQLHPDECVLTVDGEAGWKCGRPDHAERACQTPFEMPFELTAWQKQVIESVWKHADGKWQVINPYMAQRAARAETHRMVLAYWLARAKCLGLQVRQVAPGVIAIGRFDDAPLKPAREPDELPEAVATVPTLWAHRQRNTGPTGVPRAPRRIDPRRGR